MKVEMIWVQREHRDWRLKHSFGVKFVAHLVFLEITKLKIIVEIINYIFIKLF
jgi:hypothetical protein